MDENLSIERMYYELAILINQELYEENVISASHYKQTETEILKKINR